MNALMPLIQSALVNGLMAKKPSFLSFSKLGLGLLAFSGFLLLTALIYLISAGYGWLLTQYEQPMAALITSGSLTFTALVSGIIGYLKMRDKPREPAIDTDEIMKLVTSIGQMFGEEVTAPVKQNPKTAVALASAAGFMAGDKLN